MSLASHRKIRLDLSYDGSHFEGWQRQSEGRTVQGEIEKALSTLHGNTDVSIIASGRTDAGVHAAMQVVHFEAGTSSIPSERYRQALNSILPRDIRIQRSFEVPADFHARYDARMRVYRYHLVKPEDQKAFMTSYTSLCLQELDLSRLNSMAMALTGTHDFTSFAAARDPNDNKVRTIHSAYFFKEGPCTVFRVAGNAFLWKMVRTMVGTILMIHEKGGNSEDLMTILKARDRRMAGPSAKPAGLFLDKVIYDTDRTVY